MEALTKEALVASLPTLRLPKLEIPKVPTLWLIIGRKSLLPQKVEKRPSC